jgi:hypothetical protein
MKNKTAMQYLCENMPNLSELPYEVRLNIKDAFLRAIEMEEMQIVKAFSRGYLIGEDNILESDANEVGKEYFKKTYGKK